MKFTVEIKKKPPNEQFGFKDLEMFHQECYSGEIKQKYSDTWWYLICQRCGSKEIVSKEEAWMAFVKTAIDGQERKIVDWSGAENIIVTQKQNRDKTTS